MFSRFDQIWSLLLGLQTATWLFGNASGGLTWACIILCFVDRTRTIFCNFSNHQRSLQETLSDQSVKMSDELRQALKQFLVMRQDISLLDFRLSETRSTKFSEPFVNERRMILWSILHFGRSRCMTCCCRKAAVAYLNSFAFIRRPSSCHLTPTVVA